MKVLKKTIIVVIGLFVTSSIAGYFYFDKKFSPPPNYLNIEGSGDSIPITWVENEFSPIAALLLPVTLEGVPHQFYMQFDLGSHSTLFYKASLESIYSKYPNAKYHFDSTTTSIAQSFSLGKLKISSEKFRVLEHGSPVNWKKPEAPKIIGTIGADLVEQKITMIDFENATCYFGDSIPKSKDRIEFVDLIFQKRRIMIPAEIQGEKSKLLFDTGTSAFSLVTSEGNWNELAKEGAAVSEQSANSLGKILTTYTTETDESINFSSIHLKLNDVTYIEGTSPMQRWMMRLSGMDGMIGNKIFLNRTIVIDCKNGKFGIR